MKNYLFRGVVPGSFCALLLLPVLSQAKVVNSNENNFIIEHEVTVPMDAQASYRLLGKPSQWWSSEHTWSGDAKNMSLQLKAGGCFCETWKANSVMHAQVIVAQPGTLLRLQGAIGPLQELAVTGVLTYSLKPEQNGTRIQLRYRVRGLDKNRLAGIDEDVDTVLGEQLESFRKAASK